MGSAMCKLQLDAIRKNRRIDNELRKDEAEQRRKLKILLLGTSDAGKSTIVKQMRLIYAGGLNDTEIINAIFQIRMNLIDAFKQISILLLNSALEIDPDEKPTLELFAYDSARIELMQESDEIALLNSVRFYSSVKNFFRTHKTHPHIPDNIFYFFPELPRILLPNYTPTVTDVLHTRVTTLGVHEISFNFRQFITRLIDVGGQKTERRKWIHFFEDVTAVMFVTSLSCFDQYIEDEIRPASEEQDIPSVVVSWEEVPNKMTNRILVRAATKPEGSAVINRLLDSIHLFISVQQNNFLHKSCFMLFLNKRDVLIEKLKVVHFAKYFPGYEKWFQTDNKFESVSSYIESLFRNGSDNDQKIYSHFTEAINTENIEFVFNAACDVIFQQVMDQSNLE